MRHPRYCLAHHPGISSNITNATHFSIPLTLTTLAHRPLYPCWCTAHLTHAGTSPQHAKHVTHASTSLTLARHPRQHANNANTPPKLVRIPCKHTTNNTHDSTFHTPFHRQHTISQTSEYPIKLLKLLGLKFQEEIQQSLLLLFIFTAFTLKLNLFRGNQSTLLKSRLFFQKQMCNFFRKNCFLILVSF